jgi:hypothetical protein
MRTLPPSLSSVTRQRAVGVTGLGSKAFRAQSVEAVMSSKIPDATTIASAAFSVADGIDPLTDIHVSGGISRGTRAGFHAASACPVRGADKTVNFAA